MNLIWNNSRFEAQLAPGEAWKSEQEAAKAAGFKCDGPPAWTWYTLKASVLTKLRENRPVSGLTISADALAKFNELKIQEDKNAEILARLTEAKKKVKKEKEETERLASVPLYWQGKDSVGREDMPADLIEGLSKRSPIPVGTSKFCRYCHDPIYFYELEDVCIWCEIVFVDVLFGA